MKQLSRNIFIILLAIVFILPSMVSASETDGTIDIIHKYSWSENIGWINFGCNECDVHITDSEITGDAWSANYGWINLNPSTSGVLNNGEGVLSGQAWGENIGWINFSGVTIDNSGYLNGYASGSVTGQISFNCANTSSCSSSDFKIRTDWRPSSSRLSSEENNTSGGSVSIIPSIGNGTTDNYLGIGEIKSGYIINSKGKNFLVHLNSQINFAILGENKNHKANLIALDMRTGKVKIKLQSEPIIIELVIGETKQVDLDNNGINDISIKYNKLTTNRVDLTFAKLTSTINEDLINLKNGDLVKESKKSTVYLMEGNKKRPILNEQIFNANKFSWGDILEMDNLDEYQIGEIIDFVFLDNSTDISNQISSSYKFTRSLKIGDKGVDVKKIQEFLNQNGFRIIDSGLGSLGNETEYFGFLTKQALIKFQDTYFSAVLTPVGLSKGTGFFGASTIKFVNSFNSISSSKTEQKQVVQFQKKKETVVNNISISFTKNLEFGMKDNEIENLQQLLSTQADIYPEGLITGYFGLLTEKAVQKFQLKYGVVNSKSDTGFGYVGPATREKLIKVF